MKLLRQMLLCKSGNYRINTLYVDNPNLVTLDYKFLNMIQITLYKNPQNKFLSHFVRRINCLGLEMTVYFCNKYCKIFTMTFSSSTTGFLVQKPRLTIFVKNTEIHLSFIYSMMKREPIEILKGFTDLV